mgnify:CR=1 FL=1
MAETNLYNHQADYYVPDPVDLYNKGSQVIINSDRLVFNAKTDSVLVYSDKAIGFSTKGGIFFDTGTNDGESKNPSRFIVNSPQIYLGLQSGLNDGKLPTDRAVLGTELRYWLAKLLGIIDDILDDLEDSFTVTCSSPGTPSVPNPGNSAMIKLRKMQTSFLRMDLAVDDLDQLEDPEKCRFLSKRIKIV